MLFNSNTFLFLFLPVVLAGFFLIGRWYREAAAFWLFASSVAFYGMWSAAYIALLIGSIVFNYTVGVNLSRLVATGRATAATWLIRGGVAGNLLLLGYYKYANFFVDSAAELAGTHWHMAEIILPIGISFYTFTQIAFLVDCYRGEVRETNPIHYGLFVTYFPHLIAGPVLHHKEMMPQFAEAKTYRPDWENLAVGTTIFAIGLFKKVVIADGIGPFAAPVFNAAAAGQSLTALEAWGGALAFTFQLYFDFSAYSDMAIGLSKLFGVRLPLNFNSPYKAASIIDFWRRWHMTLSRFLRDYLYFALGGNRRGKLRRHLNLFITMLLGGLWHGAGWTFVAWGALHGVYLMINHGWRSLRKRLFGESRGASRLEKIAATALTFLAVVVAWVFFRAADFQSALAILQAMAGGNGFAGGDFAVFTQAYLSPSRLLGALILCAIITWGFPNSQQLLAEHRPALETVRSPSRIRWQPSARWLAICAATLYVALIEMGKVSEFLYFQF
ncbi:MAG TPA: MBOAT family protein [Rhodocyclaceae bacterium]